MRYADTYWRRAATLEDLQLHSVWMWTSSDWRSNRSYRVVAVYNGRIWFVGGGEDIIVPLTDLEIASDRRLYRIREEPRRQHQPDIML